MNKMNCFSGEDNKGIGLFDYIKLNYSKKDLLKIYKALTTSMEGPSAKSPDVEYTKSVIDDLNNKISRKEIHYVSPNQINSTLYYGTFHNVVFPVLLEIFVDEESARSTFSDLLKANEEPEEL